MSDITGAWKADAAAEETSTEWLDAATMPAMGAITARWNGRDVTALRAYLVDHPEFVVAASWQEAISKPCTSLHTHPNRLVRQFVRHASFEAFVNFNRSCKNKAHGASYIHNLTGRYAKLVFLLSLWRTYEFGRPVYTLRYACIGVHHTCYEPEAGRAMLTKLEKRMVESL